MARTSLAARLASVLACATLASAAAWRSLVQSTSSSTSTSTDAAAPPTDTPAIFGAAEVPHHNATRSALPAPPPFALPPNWGMSPSHTTPGGFVLSFLPPSPPLPPPPPAGASLVVTVVASPPVLSGSTVSGTNVLPSWSVVFDLDGLAFTAFPDALLAAPGLLVSSLGVVSNANGQSVGCNAPFYLFQPSGSRASLANGARQYASWGYENDVSRRRSNSQSGQTGKLAPQRWTAFPSSPSFSLHPTRRLLRSAPRVLRP